MLPEILFVGVGAAFRFYLGEYKEPKNKTLQKIGQEWGGYMCFKHAYSSLRYKNFAYSVFIDIYHITIHITYPIPTFKILDNSI